jgi:hypothetical protein
MENTITGDIKNLVFDTGRLRGLTLANDGIISTLSFNAYDFDGSNFINNSANGEIVNAAGNGISFENISVANAATFEINNYGLLQGSAGFNGISFVNSVVNSGVLSLIVNNYEDGDILGASSIYLEKMNVSLQVSNAGTMDSIRALETVFVNGSGITNESLGILNGIVFADNSSYVGNIVNHGKIDGEDYGILLADSKFGDTANGYGAIISNTGDILGSSSGIQFEGSSVLAAIYNYDEIAGNTGIVLSNLSNDSRVDIMNYENAIINGNNTGIDVKTPYFLGTIENEGMIYGLRQRAVSFVNTVLSGASIINSSTGVISALKEALYFEGDTEIDLALKNSGIISSTEEAAVSFNGSKITAGSEISNMEGGTITGDYVGMIFSGVEFAGNIINQGLIQGYNNGIIFNSGSIIAANAQLVNYGTIQGSNSALQISQSSNLNGTILNYGLIEGGAYGIIISSSTANAGSNSDIVNQQGGTVAGRYGIYITDSTFIGNIVNDGVIEGEIDAITVNGSIVTADKGLVGNGKLMGERSGLRISNSQWQGNLDLGGEIDAGQYGVWIGNNSSIIGVIDNFGLISSENTGIYIDNATLDLQAPFRNSGTVSGSDYGIWMDNTQLVNKLVINNDGGKITSSGIAVYLGSGLSNQEFDIHNENGTIMGGTYSVSFEESGAVSNSNQILNYYSSQSSVLRGKINMGGTSDHDVFNMSSGYATNLQVINVEEVNLSPTSASDRLVLDNRYGSFLDLTNMPNFVNENGPLVINVENNAQTDPNDEFWKRQVNIKFDTVNTNLKVGDKILVASSNSGLTINGEFGWDLGLNKLFGEYQQIGNDLYFVITKAYYEVRKANTNSFALIGQTRRLDDIIQKNQMVDLYMNKMRGDLTVDFAQNKNVMYDFYVNQLYKVRKSGLWVEYYQGNENYKKQGLVKKYDNDFKGVVVGYDRNIDKGIFGIALSYSKDNGDTFNEYSAVIDAYKGTLYGSYDFGPVFVIGNIGYSYADLDMDVVGTFDDYSEKGSVYFGSFVAGTMITKNTFAATLYSKLDVAYADTDYEEKTESQLGSLGIDLKYGYKFMSREKLIPSIYYEYGYEFSDSYLSFVNISHDNGYLQADYDYDLGKSVQKVGLRLNFMGRYGDSLAVTVEQNWREGMDAQEVRFNGTYKF